MNLSFFYPSIYWKCACLSVDAGAINEEDYYNLVDTGIIELTDDDDKREQNKVQYGKMASAISKFKSYIDIELPDINTARFGFTPDVDHNCIMFGIRGISRVGENIINEIILNRPYTSLEDFIRKMTTHDGKKLISKDRVVNLIKAGAFDRLENKPRAEILKDFIMSVADQKQRLNLMNFQMLIKQGMIPEELSFAVKVYNFTKYIRTMRYMGNYILDENGYAFYSENFDLTKVKTIEIEGIPTYVINDKYWDAIYNREMDKPRAYIKAHHDELLTELNRRLFQAEYDKYASGDILKWELDSLSFYHSGHPLTKAATQFPIPITPIPNLVENDFDGFWMIKGKAVPRYKLSTIVGAVIDKDKTKGTFTLAGVEGVIDVKLPKQVFAQFIHTISDVDEEGNKVILEDSFFEKGTFLAVTGILKGSVFVPKTYKTTGFDSILKIVLDKDGNLDYLMAKGK